MFGISKLTAAVASLTTNVLALAGTVAEVNAGVRGRLALDDDEVVAPTLPGPLPALQGPTTTADAETVPGAAGNGRARRGAKNPA